VEDAAGRLLAHRNSGSLQLIENRFVVRILGVRLRVHHHPDWNPGLPSLDELGRIATIFDEPERHVDPNDLLSDEIDQRRPAVLKGSVAQALCGTRRNGSRDHDAERDDTDHKMT